MTAEIKKQRIADGTTGLIGFFDVASGRMEVPYPNPTRTEEDFVKAVEIGRASCRERV